YPAPLRDARQRRLHAHRARGRAHRVAAATTAAEVKKAAEAVGKLEADPANDSSQLGAAVRQVLNDFRGSSLAAVVMLTDGVTTEGEGLARGSRYSASPGGPLVLVRIGEAREQPAV